MKKILRSKTALRKKLPSSPPPFPIQPSIGLDIEATGLKLYKGTIWSLTVKFSKNFPIKKFAGKNLCYHNCNGLTRKDIPAEILALIESPLYLKVVHSSQYDGPYLLLNAGVKVPNIWDSQVNEVVIQGIRIPRGNKDEQINEAFSSSLKYVNPRYGFKQLDKSITKNFIARPLGIPFTTKEKKYMVEDVEDLCEIQVLQELILNREGLVEVSALENKLAERIISMRANGIGFDSKFWKQHAIDNEVEYRKRIDKLPKAVQNWNSPAQVKEYFKKRGVYIESFKKIYNVYMATQNKTLAEFIWAKELAKSVSTYGINWFEEGFIDEDGRVRCGIDQSVDTGRMSIAEPPLQQMPGVDIKNFKKQRAMRMVIEQLGLKGRLIPQHRRAFIPAKGKIFIAGDFGGQEMGIMAAQSGEEMWINAMLRGEDIHALTASLLYSTEWPQATEKGCRFPFKCNCKGHKALREPTKILNFMLAYGGGAEKFSDDTGLDIVTSTMIVSRYKKIIPRLTKWLNDNGRDGVNTGWSYSADPYRRRRRLHGDEEWEIKNQGKNTPVQAAAANMIKLAMISIPSKWHIPLVVHDEIIMEVDFKERFEAAKAQKKIMEDTADYITGIKGLVKVEPRICTSWMKDDGDVLLREDGKFYNSGTNKQIKV
jgi:DNA polymerase I-like protein with 3'-5' exonuclease and polymerase domains